MRHISFLLGAGFSVAAGYPTAKKLNARLSNLKAAEIDIYSEGTARFNNGNPDPNQRLRYQENLFIEKYINWYNDIILMGNKEDFNYEKFYDFTKQLKRKQINLTSFDLFCKKFSKEVYNNRNHPDNSNLLHWFLNSFNQLVSDLIHKKEDNIYSTGFDPRYSNILSFIYSQLKLGSVHIHSLNHDLLFESLANSEDLSNKFHDGFEELGSPFYGKFNGYNIRLKRFINYFPEEKILALYKLHGSLDQYIYCTNNNIFALKKPPGIYNTELYMEEVNEKGQLFYRNYPWNHYSDFLTGTREKIKSYSDFYYYNALFRHFTENLKKSDCLFVIGYGFRDSEINRYIINNFLFRKRTRMIVIDPFPNKLFTESNVFYIKKYMSGVSQKVFNRFI